MINIPKTQTFELSDAERFCIGLRELAMECNLTSIKYSSIGVISYDFADGSGVGCIRAHREANLLS
jgi:hypothetical protein